LRPHILQQTSAMPPSRIAPPTPPTTPPMMLLLELESPPFELLEEDWPRAGVDVMVAKPVVVAETLRDVEVIEETAPLACVVMMTVTIDLVDVET
jgi:hypothetical protein